MATVIDTFPQFQAVWQHVAALPIETQVECWQSEYMSQWPELLQKQIQSYLADGIDWKAIAAEKVFPCLPTNITLMERARGNLLDIIPNVYDRAGQIVGLDFDVVFVVYVGIGCGAGWATTLRGRPACLLGLENIAECGWLSKERLSGLVAHELGHLLHYEWRVRQGIGNGTGPLWQLYEEGFAQRCEPVILSTDTWHEQETGWLQWCQEHSAWLADRFLNAVSSGQSVQDFFGSWHSIAGHSQCGYYLGHEVIKAWEQKDSLYSIALMTPDQVDSKVLRTLELIANRCKTT